MWYVVLAPRICFRMKDTPHNTLSTRPPVIVVLGHVDHGKSTLLDYIRHTNIVAGEAGGITQKVSAYEVEHQHEGSKRRITFLDTPGHEAFKNIRARGAESADIAILVVSAEDGVRPQTLEAWNAVQQSGIPCVIAINKIDRQNANIEKTKANLLEHGIYIEGMGGDTPAVPISAKVGTGIPELLDTLLLVADVAELTGDESIPAEGVVIESERDPKKGIAATLLIKNGTLRAGDMVLAGTALAPVRIFEDFAGNTIKKATFSSPVRVVGFDTLPHAGAPFRAFTSKKEAESARSAAAVTEARFVEEQEDERFVIPIIIKAEANGSIEGIVHELKKIENDRARIKVIVSGIGAISENDIKTAVASPGTLVVGFNVPADAVARDMADNNHITIRTFSIIYELADYVREHAIQATPKQKQDNIEGTAQIFKVFSNRKDTYTIGGKVLSGALFTGHNIKVLRGDTEIARGKLATLQVNKSDATRADEGTLWGAQIDVPEAVHEHDTLVCFTTIET